MKRLGIVVMMAVAVAAYKDRRALEDFPPYQAARQHPPFHEQHQPFREQSFKQFQSFRQRPYRQDLSSYAEQPPFRERPVFRDYPSARSRPFHEESPSFRDPGDLKRQSSFYLDGPFRDQPPFKGEQILDQSLSDIPYQQPSFRDDFRFSDLYDKPVDSYKDQEQRQAAAFGRDSEYLKHGNHGLGYVSVPPISSYENALPLNDEGSTTATTPTSPTSTQKSLLQSTASSASTAITQVHTSATSEPKTVSHSVTMPSVKSDTLAEAAAIGASTPTAATASAPTGKQSSSLAQAALTTSLPVVATEAPILSFGRQTLPPIEFQAGKFTTPASYYVTSGLKGKLQQSLLSYLLSQQAKTAIKSNDHSSLLNYALPDVLSNNLNNKIQAQSLNYALPDVLNNNFNNKIQAQQLNYALPDVLGSNLNNKLQAQSLNYVLPEESKTTLKDNLLNYLLQPESNRGLSFQPSSVSETVNYVPLGDLTERPKLQLPSMPIASLSAISRPLQTVNYVSPTVPKVPSFVTQDSSSSLQLGATLPSTLASSIPVAPSTSIFGSLPSGISGIPAGISSGISPSLPVSIPTLNLGQNFQHIGQLRQFEAPRSQPVSYSTGLQMQLGGFGGMDYTLRSSNPVSRPLELGIAKVGLSLPEIPRQEIPTFSKVGLEQHMW